MNMIYYFAYGSNLHPVRLLERMPSAELVGVAKLHNYRLAFHKKSYDNSGKCNMFRSDNPTDLVYGAIYRLKMEDKHRLDRVEGKGYGYIDTQINVTYADDSYNCFSYIAQQDYIIEGLQPYHWYKQLVVIGAQYLKFPESYISSIKSVESVEDYDLTKRKQQEALIERIDNY